MWAFYELQDLFDVPIFKGMEYIATFLRLWYFYYESKYILVESFLCGLNGFYHSSTTMLRIFLEFNVLQNYYYLRTINSRSYGDLLKCLNTGVNPKWSTLMKGFLPNRNSFLPINTIKNRIEAHYEALSENSTHPYHEKFSPKIITGASIPRHSLTGIMTFWLNIDYVLESIIWMYYTNFPMVLQSKDLLKKFGHNGPVGVFIDSSREPIMKNALRKEDLDIFQNFSNQNENVKFLNEWYNNQNTLTPEEIISTWDADEYGDIPESIEKAMLLKICKLRAMREFSALHTTTSDDKNDFPIELSLKNCSRILTELKRKKSAKDK